MKIAIPTNDRKGLEAEVAGHFGRCLTYTFLNEKGEVEKIIDNTSERTAGAGLPPELIKEHGARVLLCQELGPRALDMCGRLEIEVYLGPAKNVKEIFEMWKNNELKKAETNDVCEQHKT